MNISFNDDLSSSFFCYIHVLPTAINVGNMSPMNSTCMRQFEPKTDERKIDYMTFVGILVTFDCLFDGV